MRKLLVFLIVLAVLLGVLDRVAVAGAQREIARHIEATYDLATTPTVEIRGIPFLTQAVGGRYEEIAVSLGSLTVQGVRLSGVDATLHGVTVSLADLLQDPGGADIRAERVTGTVVISKETLDARAPRGVKVEEIDADGIRVRGELTVLGRSVPVSATMKIEVEERALRVVPTDVEVEGGFAVPNAARLVTFEVPIRELPLDMKITEVRTGTDGVAVDAAATDVPLRG